MQKNHKIIQKLVLIPSHGFPLCFNILLCMVRLSQLVSWYWGILLTEVPTLLGSPQFPPVCFFCPRIDHPGHPFTLQMKSLRHIEELITQGAARNGPLDHSPVCHPCTLSVVHCVSITWPISQNVAPHTRSTLRLCKEKP